MVPFSSLSHALLIIIASGGPQRPRRTPRLARESVPPSKSMPSSQIGLDPSTQTPSMLSGSGHRAHPEDEEARYYAAYRPRGGARSSDCSLRVQQGLKDRTLERSQGIGERNATPGDTGPITFATQRSTSLRMGRRGTQSRTPGRRRRRDDSQTSCTARSLTVPREAATRTHLARCTPDASDDSEPARRVRSQGRYDGRDTPGIRIAHISTTCVQRNDGGLAPPYRQPERDNRSTRG